jgi:hypothetical protein
MSVGWTVPISKAQLDAYMVQIEAGRLPAMVQQWQQQAREAGFFMVCLVEYDGDVSNRTGVTVSVECFPDGEG